MKKAVMGILSVVMVLTLAFSLVGCGVDSEKKQEAIERHTQIAASFNEVATLINDNADLLDNEVITAYREMSDLLNVYTDILNGDQEISDEKYDEMIKWFDSVDEWVAETKSDIEATLAAAEQ